MQAAARVSGLGACGVNRAPQFGITAEIAYILK
jgi:hypothetical protein